MQLLVVQAGQEQVTAKYHDFKKVGRSGSGSRCL